MGLAGHPAGVEALGGGRFLGPADGCGEAPVMRASQARVRCSPSLATRSEVPPVVVMGASEVYGPPPSAQSKSISHLDADAPRDRPQRLDALLEHPTAGQHHDDEQSHLLPETIRSSCRLRSQASIPAACRKHQAAAI